MDLSLLSDARLRERLKALACDERASTAALLRHLAELDARRGSAGWGYPSLFAYCTKELRFSEGGTYRRIAAARAGAAHPLVFALLESGELSLEGVALLRPHLTPENAARVIERARGMTCRGVESLIAELAPRPDIRDCLMRLPGPGGTPSQSGAEAPMAPTVSLDETEAGPLAAGFDRGAVPFDGAPEPKSPPPPRDEIEPLSPARVHIGFTADTALLEKLERAKAVLRHKHPSGRLADIVSELAEAFLEAKDPGRAARRRQARREAKTLRERPGAGPGAPAVADDGLRRSGSRSAARGRAIPAAVRDAAWLRDGGRCAFVSEDGRRCDEQDGLEFDHLLAWAKGGRSDDPANIRLLCREHNQHEARRAFGASRVGPRPKRT